MGRRTHPIGRWLSWLVPLAVVAIGFMTIAAGFVYDLMLAGLPYQDPPSELEARWQYHSGVASAIEFAGAVVMFLGLSALAVAVVWALAKRRD